MSIRKRLTLFYSLSIIVIALLLVGVFFWALIHAVSNTTRITARAQAELAATMLKAGEPLDRNAMARFSADNTAVIARDGQGRIVVQSGAVTFDQRKADTDLWQRVLATGQPAQGEGTVRQVSGGPDVTGDVHIYAVPVNLPGTPIRVVEAITSFGQTARSGFAYELFLVAFVVVLIVLAIVAGYLLSRAALAPVDRIVHSVDEMSAHDLSRRLPVENPNDELGRLSATFNGLLNRLEVAFRAREDSLARERRFVADASHELRTPLTSILGYTRMLRDWGLGDPATAEESTAAIGREASRMSVLVDGLLSLARGDEHAPLDLSPHDLREVGREAVAAARVKASDRLTVATRLPDDPVPVMLDRDRMRQLVDILLDNALKYTEPGGTVTLTVQARDDRAELAVADTGVGIPAPDLPHVFERFYRVDAARSTGGSGLGLAIARQIAEAHGGTIEVESESGRGSTFRLILPLISYEYHVGDWLETRGRGASREGTP